MLYRCGFVHDPAAGGEMFLLRFDGVYYSARVWLNGVYLGDHEGYFAAFEFDVTAYLREGQNELLVEVYSPEESEENDKKTIGGVWARWDGMDPELNPGGIFRDVSLVSAGKVHFRTLGAAADHTGRGRVHLTLYAHEALRTTMVGRAQPLGFQAPGALASKEIRLEPGENRVELGFSLPRVRAWWTWDRGEQPMYEMTVSCGGAEQSVRFGARTVEMRDWQVYLNGVRTYLRGINHLPTDAYPARTTGDRSRADADLVREAGMNAVRVHAHVAEEEYYDACDARGLLVLQDFPLQWTHRRSVLEPAVRQAKEMARDLQRHPCVAIYLAHDEPFYVVPPEKWSVADILRTAAEVLAPRWALWQRRVLDPAVVRALEEEDPARPVIDAAGHPLTTNHLYFGWYYGKFRDLERVVNIVPGLSRLPTEYGAQALPNGPSLEEIWPAGKPPDWETLSSRYRLQASRMEHYVPWRGDRNAFVRESQEYQAEVLKHATELFRRRKYRPTGGTFPFMLNDPAPAISWSVVDWNRRKKSAYDTVAKAMSPVLICCEFPRERYDVGGRLSLPLFVVNDLARGVGPVRWSWELIVKDQEISRAQGEIEFAPDSVTRIGRVAASLRRSGPAVLRMALHGDGVEADNTYAFDIEEASRGGG